MQAFLPASFGFSAEAIPGLSVVPEEKPGSIDTIFVLHYNCEKRTGANDLPAFAPKASCFKKRMNPSWNSWKPSLAAKVLKTPYLWSFSVNELIGNNESLFQL
jgi:hypothetical protein